MYIDPIALQFPLFGRTIAIHWYGVIIAAGLLLAILLAMSHTKRAGHNPDIVLDLALIVVPLAVIGARIYYVIPMWDELYAGGPFWKVFAVWEGGLAIYGGVIGGLIGALIYTRFNKSIKLLQLLDILAPSLILGQAIGRWGNFVNQEAYGAVITDPAWQWFPAAVFIRADGQYHMATFFYESLWNFIVFLVLTLYFRRSKKRVDGNVFWLYLLLYGIGRAVIEGLRLDSLYWGSFRVSQVLSGVLVVAAAIVLIVNTVRRREPKEPVELDDSLRLMPKDEVHDLEAASPMAAESLEDGDAPTIKEAALDAPAVTPLMSAPPVADETPEKTKIPEAEDATPDRPL